MKVKVCPTCGCNSLGERWCKGRKIEQYCNEEECYWHGEPYTPSKRDVSRIKKVYVDQFCGHVFETFDKYGHPMLHSRTYDSERKALAELEKELIRGEKDDVAGPYTAVLWPKSVKVVGKKFIVKKGRVLLT